MENEKKFSFNTKDSKSNIMIINGKRKAPKDVKILVKKGEIKKSEKYKYLGTWLNNRGTFKDHLDYLKSITPGMIEQLKKFGCSYKLGRFNISGQLLIYETTVLPAILYNLEAWTTFTKLEEEELEKIQAKALKRIFELPTSTPYIGILMETGLWTIKDQVVYKKMMLYKNVLNSDDSRIMKIIIENQMKNDDEGTWANELKEKAKCYNIDLNNCETMSKQKWRKYVKDNINNKIAKEVREKSAEMTKLWYIKDNKFEMKNYIKTLSGKEITSIMRIRLNMINIGVNYGKIDICRICQENIETLEHLFSCDQIKNLIKSDIKIDMVSSENTSDLMTVNKYVNDVMELIKSKKILMS